MSVFCETARHSSQLGQLILQNVKQAFANGVYNHPLYMWSSFFVSWHLFAALFAVLDHTKWLCRYKIVMKDPVSRVFSFFFFLSLVAGFVVFFDADCSDESNCDSASCNACCCPFQSGFLWWTCALVAVSSACLFAGSCARHCFLLGPSLTPPQFHVQHSQKTPREHRRVCCRLALHVSG